MNRKNFLPRNTRTITGMHLIRLHMTNLKIKRKISYFIAIIALGILTGCDLTGCGSFYMKRKEKCPSYVVCYVNLESVRLSVDCFDGRCVFIEPGFHVDVVYGLHSSGAEKEKYDQLCIKHNDLSYNQDHIIIGDPPRDYESVTHFECDFTKITVTTDKDFDETHPAGTDLSDVVRFMSWSPCKYILSGYSDYYHYDKSDVSDAFDTMMRRSLSKECFNEDMEYFPIDKLVKDLTADDLILVGYNPLAYLGMLYFDKLPSEQGEYEIAVSIKTDDGKTLSGTVEMHF